MQLQRVCCARSLTSSWSALSPLNLGLLGAQNCSYSLIQTENALKVHWLSFFFFFYFKEKKERKKKNSLYILQKEMGKGCIWVTKLKCHLLSPQGSAWLPAHIPV